MRKREIGRISVASLVACLAILSGGAARADGVGDAGAPRPGSEPSLTPAYALSTSLATQVLPTEELIDEAPAGAATPARELPTGQPGGEAPTAASQAVEARPSGAASGEEAAGKPDARGYRVGPEDVLEISVWKEEGLKKEVLVRPDGGISFPLVGEVKAAGKTAEAIAAEIETRIKRSINDPVVSVSVLKIAGNRIYVIGRVAKPGEFVSGRYVDVLQALAMAGGLTPYASENDIRILRKHDGVEETFEFRYSDVRRGRKLEQNITLQGGDVVVVP